MRKKETEEMWKFISNIRNKDSKLVSLLLLQWKTARFYVCFRLPDNQIFRIFHGNFPAWNYRGSTYI